MFHRKFARIAHVPTAGNMKNAFAKFDGYIKSVSFDVFHWITVLFRYISAHKEAHVACVFPISCQPHVDLG